MPQFASHIDWSASGDVQRYAAKNMEPDFQSESWEQTGPSYIQSYVVSAFLFVGLLTVAFRQVPLTPLSLIFLSVWFGAFFYWLVQNRHAERTFASDRITIAGGRVAHTFRYAITESEHTDMLIADIKSMTIHSGQPIAIELVGDRDSDFLMLPDMETVTEFTEALLKQNPDIEIAT